MPTAEFPGWMRRWPEADIPLDGVLGRIFQAADHQIVFFEIEPIGTIPPHSHGAQWGVVVEGRMELTIEGVARTYGPGDSYDIPAGAVHSARFLSRVRAIDVFADVDRYRPRGAAAP